MKALLALLFAIAAAVTGPVALFAYNVESRFLTADAAKELVDSAGFYEELPQLAAQGVREDDEEEFAKGATDAELLAFFQAMLSREAMQPYVDHAVDQFTAFARGESESAEISTAELKRAIIARAPEAVMALVASKPECARGSSPNDDGAWLSCRPRAGEEVAFRERIATRVAEGVNDIPETFVVPDGAAVAEFERDFPRERRQQVVQASAWGWLIPLGCLLLIGMLYSHSRRAMAAWVGVPTFIAGGLALGLAKLLEAGWAEAISEMRAEAADAADRFGARVTEAIGQAFFEPVLLQGSVVTAIGAVLIGAAFMLHDEDDPARGWPG